MWRMLRLSDFGVIASDVMRRYRASDLSEEISFIASIDVVAMCFTFRPGAFMPFASVCCWPRFSSPVM